MKSCAPSLLLLLGATLPAMEQPLNDGWSFWRGDAPGAEAPGFDDRAWRVLDLPHDASLDDLPSAGQGPQEIDAVTGTWRFRAGDDRAWSAPGLDDRAWETHDLPGGWRSRRGADHETSFGWYRRTLPVQAGVAAGAPVVLLLGRIDDADETWLNGVRLGATGTMPPFYVSAWSQERAYEVPPGLLKNDGTDVLAVRVYNGQADGGLVSTPQASQRVGPFDTRRSQGGAATGWTVGGTVWYRRTLVRDPAWAGKRVELRFDGVYRNATVTCNGTQVGFHAYGYTGFGVDLTPHLRDGANVVAVEVANTGANSRWYSGTGIFRDVHLRVTDPVAIPAWGIGITTPEVSDQQALVRVEATVANHTAAATPVEVVVRLRDGAGAEVAAGRTQVAAVPAAGRQVVPLAITLPKPRRWSLEDPHRYTAETTVLVGGRETARETTAFGVRTVEIDAIQGFRLNGVPMKLRGGCIHHDNGPLGAVSLQRAEDRRVELLKERGFNAVRLAHNPPSVRFLEACDRLGMLVINEAFDMWEDAKNPDDYHRDFPTHGLADIDAMVLRDRNHPSIIAWSIGNEIPERFSERGVRTTRALAGRVRSLDPGRPVTAALNGGWNEQTDQGVADAIDLFGYNYQLQRYGLDHRRDPRRVIYASESFPLYAADHWYGVLDHPHVIGDFVWTAMDYLGEAGCGFNLPKGPAPFYELQPFPMYTGNTGDLDLCGFQRPQSLFRDVLWDLRPAAIVVDRPGRDSHPNAWGWHDVEPSWTWDVAPGTPMTVQVYAKADRVDLLQDGAPIGSAPAGRAQGHIATFTVPWKPGELTAVVHQGGKTATTSLATVGRPTALRLVADRPSITAAPGDLAYVTVEVVDAQGRRVPGAVVPVDIAVQGAGRLRATGNGSPSDPASFTAPTRRTWDGRALIILQPTGTGPLDLAVQAPGLQGAAMQISVR